MQYDRQLSRHRILRCAPPGRQHGVVLVIALIVLVAMTLAGIALVRSVDTTNVIAGNLAFQQAATHSGDQGVETAVAWLNSAGATALQGDSLGDGYISSYHPNLPASNQTWDNYWTTSGGLGTNAKQILSGGTDAAGNQISYVIERMCQKSGNPLVSQCSFAPFVCSPTGADVGDPKACEHGAPQVYYRITSRIVGPHNTVSYVQAMIAL